MTSRLLTALAALMAAALLTCSTAAASPTQESLLGEDTLLLEYDHPTRERALDDMVALGVDVVRVNVFWNRMAPSATARRRPAGFDATDPAAYEIQDWDPYDDTVRAALARGLDVLLTPTSPLPRWASECRSGTAKALQACKPKVAEFRDFVRAVGRRYSGAYTDENQGALVLPRVSRWSIWNEPNQPGWLYPQLERRGGRTLAFAAHRYRALAQVGIASLRATGHRRDQILLGETAPLGTTGGSPARRAIPPLTFLREMLCIDDRGRRLAGSAARIRDCGSIRRLPVTGYAHHPYTRAAGGQPRIATPPEWSTIGSIERLTTVLDQAGRAGRVPRSLPVHFTEFGFQTNPPDRISGVSLAKQALWLNWSDFIAYNNRRVRTVAQYKLTDDISVSGFNTGLRLADGRLKPSWNAYRLPIYVVRAGSGARVYGQARAATGRVPVRIEWRAAGRGAWRTLATTRTSRTGHLSRKVSRRSGQFRLRWAAPGGDQLSRTAVIGPA